MTGTFKEFFKKYSRDMEEIIQGTSKDASRDIQEVFKEPSSRRLPVSLRLSLPGSLR